MSVNPYAYSRGSSQDHKTRTFIPKESDIRCLRDQMIVEPIDGVLSAILIVINECRPVRGIVRAIGPGHYPKLYDHPEKHKRTKMWDSKRFQPTNVKVGDVVDLGGLNIGGYAFQTFYHGEKLMMICREADVCAILDDFESTPVAVHG